MFECGQIFHTEGVLKRARGWGAKALPKQSRHRCQSQARGPFLPFLLGAPFSRLTMQRHQIQGRRRWPSVQRIGPSSGSCDLSLPYGRLSSCFQKAVTAQWAKSRHSLTGFQSHRKQTKMRGQAARDADGEAATNAAEVTWL